MARSHAYGVIDVSRLFDLSLSILAAVGCFIVGWLWSLSTWHRGFDMGWLVVAFVVLRTISARYERGRLRAKEYLSASWPALPAFVLEGLSSLNLHRFSIYGRPGQLVRFSVFSSLFLIVIAAATALLRFGIGIGDLSPEDYSMSDGAIRMLALAVSVSVSIGTLILLIEGAGDLHARLASLQSWFYKVSLIVYFVLIAKSMLPLILQRLRT
jgi:hypothetical protein